MLFACSMCNVDICHVFQTEWERSLLIEGVPFHEHFRQYCMKRERELMGEIASRRTVVHERMPTVDREKFKRRFKEEDKQELDALFTVEDEEDVKESFQKVIDEGRLFLFVA